MWGEVRMMKDELSANDEIQRTPIKKFGFWASPFIRRWLFLFAHGAVLAILFPIAALAQRSEPRPVPLDPVQAAREARELVADMLAQKPSQTNTGLLKIRDAKGQEKEWPMRFEIWSGKDSSISTYEATDPQTHRKIKLTVHHSDGQPNQYLLAESGAAEKRLAGNETMIPFAGSDFWVADLGLEFLHFPQQRLQSKEMRRSRFCDVLESINSKPSAGGYSNVVCWVEKERPHGIVHADAYDAKGKVIKRFDPKEFEKVEGEYQLQEMEIRNVQTGSRTSIEFDLGPPTAGHR